MKFLIFAIFVTSFTAQAQSLEQWSITKNAKENLLLNPLKFSNRARCALDSKKPADSVFFMVDNVAVSKTIHRYATLLGKDTKQEVKLATERFRYTITKLAEVVSKKLFLGELPILKGDDFKLKDYPLFVKKCKDSNDCDPLYNLIGSIWNSSTQIDNGFSLAMKEVSTSCYYLNKFSSLEGHLFARKPNVTTMKMIGESVHKSDEYLTKCDDFSKQTSAKVANYQFEILNTDQANWDYYGFDFWSSFKQYFSWAFRQSQLMEKLAFPYGTIFKSISIEQSLIFVPNGCKSINKPECSTENLSLNSMRFFTQTTDEQAIFNHDMLEQLPDGPEFDLLSNSTADVSDDILNMNQFEYADQWAENFRNNFTKARGFVKLKFLKAVNSMALIKSKLTPEIIANELEKTLNKLTEQGTPKVDKNLIQSELYYLCSEYKIASDEKLSFLFNDLQILEQLTTLENITKTVNKEQLGSYFETFKNIAPKVQQFCNKLESLNIWDDYDFTLNRDGYHSWYQEYVFNKKVPFKTRTINKLKDIFNPLVTFATFENSKRRSNIVCTEGANCSRMFLDNIIDLYAIVQYSDSLVQISNEIKAPNMLNPMSERYACNTYNPWFQLKKSIAQFFHDISQAALFTYVPSPIYVDIEINEKKPVSFNKLVKDGKIYFDPQYKNEKLRGSIIADFGPLLGLPCSISISNTKNNPGKYYAFNGISVGACKENERNVMTVMSASDVSNSDRENSSCFSCALNLQTISSSLSRINPLTRGAFFLAKGVYTLYQNLKDPHNIPRSWSVDINSVYNTYRKYGHVNKFCTRKLRKDKHCMANKCEAQIALQVNKFFKGAVVESQINKHRYDSYIRLNTCDEVIRIKTSYNRKRICDKGDLTINDFVVPETCRHILKGNSND